MPKRGELEQVHRYVAKELNVPWKKFYAALEDATDVMLANRALRDPCPGISFEALKRRMKKWDKRK